MISVPLTSLRWTFCLKISRKFHFHEIKWNEAVPIAVHISLGPLISCRNAVSTKAEAE